MKKIVSLFLRISISVILLVFLFKLNKINLPDLAEDIKGAGKFYLVAGFSVFVIAYILGFLRWWMLLRPSGIKIPLKRLIISYLGGNFFSIFLPSTIGGDLVRVADLSGYTKKTKEVIATVFLDRLSGYVGLVMVIIPAFLLGASLVKDKVVLSSIVAIIGLLVIILLILFNRFVYFMINRFFTLPWMGRAGGVINSLHMEIHMFRNHKKLLVCNFILSAIIQLISPVSVFFIALSLGIRIKFLYFLIFLPVIGAITLLPIAIGGLGLRENLFAVYFAKVGVTKQLAVAMSLLSFSFIVIYGAIGGLFYVLTVHNRRLQRNQPSSVQKTTF